MHTSVNSSRLSHSGLNNNNDNYCLLVAVRLQCGRCHDIRMQYHRLNIIIIRSRKTVLPSALHLDVFARDLYLLYFELC